MESRDVQEILNATIKIGQDSEELALFYSNYKYAKKSSRVLARGCMYRDACLQSHLAIEYLLKHLFVKACSAKNSSIILKKIYTHDLNLLISNISTLYPGFQKMQGVVSTRNIATKFVQEFSRWQDVRYLDPAEKTGLYREYFKQFSVCAKTVERVFKEYGNMT